MPAHQGFFATTPTATEGTVGAKLVTVYPRNDGDPTHHPLIQLSRPETGEPLVTSEVS